VADSIQASRADLTKARAECWKLYDFVKVAWPHVPALSHVPFVPGWHIAYICEHLEAISKGVFLELTRHDEKPAHVAGDAVHRHVISR
jgi:hypothetical protein